MKILVVGDAHGNIELMKDLQNQYPNMDLYLDAGDNLSDSYTLFPFRSCKGNCDFFNFEDKVLIRTAYGNIFMRHVPYITEQEKKDTIIFIHGHTHKYKIEKKDNLIILCPGSVALPKDDSHGTYAIINLKEGLISIDIIDIFTKKILLHF